MKQSYIPLLLFMVLAIFLVVGLKLNPSLIPSPLLNKPAPEIALPQLHEPDQLIKTADFKGKVWLLNVWASWCTTCRAEHPLLIELLQDEVFLVGLNYKDEPTNATKWLADLGNPYQFSAVDATGAVGLNWGVYGVPETFVIDANGTIRHKHVGPLSKTDIVSTILPLVHRLQKGAS